MSRSVRDGGREGESALGGGKKERIIKSNERLNE